MYTSYFGLTDKPFSITPDPRFLFLGERHAEALAHLQYGVLESGGFIQLTGEVGTGKTTVMRSLLLGLPDNVRIAAILNPQVDLLGFLRTICQEFAIAVADDRDHKSLLDALNTYLLDCHANGQRAVLVIDEAQNLDRSVLEQIRLLTNLETETAKLLQIILIGQEELRDTLDRADLRQLAQRITGRYHLGPLSAAETAAYVRHRLDVAGATQDIFTPGALREVHRCAGGVPRLVNVICDRALLGAYSRQKRHVDGALVRRAHAEIRGQDPRSDQGRRMTVALAVAGTIALSLGAGSVGWRLAAGAGDGTPPSDGASVRLAGAEPRGAASGAPGGAPRAGRTADRTAPAAGDPPVAAVPGTGANTRGASGYSGPAAAPGAAASAGAGISPGARRSLGTAGGTSPGSRDGDAGGTSRAAGTGSMTARAGPAVGASPADPAPAGGTGSAASPSAPPASLDQLLFTNAARTTTDHAFDTLFARWGVEGVPANEAPCAWGRRNGLRCEVQLGSWRLLGVMNRPAILSLVDSAGDRHHVVATGLDQDHVELLVGGAAHRFTLDEVTPHWMGEYLLLWRPNPRADSLMLPGSSGPDVAWLRQSLASVTPASGGGTYTGAPDFYDEGLTAQVRDFQRRSRLMADGKAGLRTLIALNTALQVSGTPTLSAPDDRADDALTSAWRQPANTSGE